MGIYENKKDFELGESNELIYRLDAPSQCGLIRVPAADSFRHGCALELGLGRDLVPSELGRRSADGRWWSGSGVTGITKKEGPWSGTGCRRRQVCLDRWVWVWVNWVWV